VRCIHTDYSSRGLRHIQRWGTRPVKDLRPDLLSNIEIKAVTGFAARVPVTAQVNVPIILDKVKPEGTHSLYIIMEWRVNMPGRRETRAVGVEEYDGGGEGVIVVY
jgi:hypothetical protein